MKIKVYAICWNEEILAPYFLKHYKQYTDEIVVYDNMSTDATCEILKDCEIRKYDTNEKIRDDIYLNIKNEAWKETIGSAVDWVIICDMDELIYSTTLLAALQKAKEEGYTIIKPQGYEMMGNSIPTTSGQIYCEFNQGVEDISYSKPCIIDPNKIESINYAPGCHSAKANGIVNILETSDIRLLHYKYFDLDFVLNRYSTYETRLSDENLRNDWGTQYTWAVEEITNRYNAYINKMEKVV